MHLPLIERVLCTESFLRHERTTDLRHPDRAEQHLRARLRLAALLGLPYQNVSAAYPPVEIDGHRQLFLTATDPIQPDTRLWFYLPDAAHPFAPFYAMGPCPGCEANVPLICVTVLADLAPVMRPRPARRRVPPAPRDPVFLAYPAHPRTCPYRCSAGRSRSTVAPTRTR